MGKKKRQEEPNANMDDTSESSDEARKEVKCPHIKKALDVNQVKRAIAKCSFQTECEQCKKNPSDVNLFDDGIEFDTSLWLCLRCGNQACGRSKKEHALQHYKTPHSDSHSLCLNTSDWRIWCYECDDEVSSLRPSKLSECVEYLKKKQQDLNKTKNSPIINECKVLCLVETNSIGTLNPSSSLSFLPRARGLSNLGNTCFFNSVMQCLGQTPYLYELLQETSEKGQYFNLPGGKLYLDDEQKKNIELEPIEGYLDEWKTLNKALAETLRELQSGAPEVVNPHVLHGRLTARLPQFGGGDQHDAHELLRHLLEAVREEDLKRYQTIILEKLDLSTKCDPATVDEVKRKTVKFYGAQASELLLPTEQVFRGVLISTLQCQDCNHMSHRNECFLDLSLPISEKQMPPMMRRKAEELDDQKPSKYQLKKERKQAKKNKKSKSHRIATAPNPVTFNNDDATLNEQNTDNNSESESDADIEDNVEDSSNNVRSPDDGPSKGTESGYNSDKNGSPDNISPDMCVDDSGVPSPTVGMLNVSPLGPDSPDNSPASSETNIDMGSPLCGRNTPNDEVNEEFERPESRLSFVQNKNNDIKADLEKLSIEDEDEKMDVEEDLWCSTISARTNIQEGECSVQSCLNQFTTSELMTSNNKVGCETCTKRNGGSSNKKIIYTNAKKQLLIYNPPAVLILHLKRFQIYHFRAAKIQKYVQFPTILDIAPFCSVKSKSLPTFEIGQKKVLYSLYGVVEHSGGMHGGHYVAYVKVRPKLDENSYRWQFLPKNQKKEFSKENIGEVPQGKWYYISDSHTSEVNEERVLNARAYLLFYERIM